MKNKKNTYSLLGFGHCDCFALSFKAALQSIKESRQAWRKVAKKLTTVKPYKHPELKESYDVVVVGWRT